jgi:hypothetical protein
MGVCHPPESWRKERLVVASAKISTRTTATNQEFAANMVSVTAAPQRYVYMTRWSTLTDTLQQFKRPESTLLHRVGQLGKESSNERESAGVAGPVSTDKSRRALGGHGSSWRNLHVREVARACTCPPLDESGHANTCSARRGRTGHRSPRIPRIHSSSVRPPAPECW